MKIEQIKFNAESIKKKGLDEKIIEIAKEAYEESKHQWCGEETHILNEKPIAQILGLFGGSIKGMKVLDLGCGYGGFNDGDYAPILSTALAYLGADVTGIDYLERSEEGKKRLYEKYLFHYENLDLTNFFLNPKYTNLDNKTINIFKDNDLMIARSLLNYGLEMPRLPPACRHIEHKYEWSMYKGIIKEIQQFNGKKALYNLQMPMHSCLKNYLSNNESANLFNETFGEIIFDGKENGFFCGHVFTTG